MIYIISLEKALERRTKCLHQMNKYNIKNYKFYNAIDTVSTNKYDELYLNVTKNMTTNYIKNNFFKGALGCLLSHLEVIKEAKEHNYKQILILEDDFIFIKDFKNKLSYTLKNINYNWDLIYIGKKQGGEYKSITENSIYYLPNKQTFATHGLLIKNTMYDELINLYSKLNGAVDLLLHELYNKFNIIVLSKDLVITYEDSFIRETEDYSQWNWKKSLYDFE
jgi:GR25 family glycosyltransferase involved in LPS biosynthesis